MHLFELSFNALQVVSVFIIEKRLLALLQSKFASDELQRKLNILSEEKVSEIKTGTTCTNGQRGSCFFTAGPSLTFLLFLRFNFQSERESERKRRKAFAVSGAFNDMFWLKPLEKD